MTKNWWFKLDFKVWRTDSSLRECSLETRGFWLDVLCVMHERDVSGITGTYERLARLLGCTPEEVARCAVELKETNTADVTLGNGDVTIKSRRLERELKVRNQTRLRVRNHRGNGDVTPMKHDRVISNKKEVRNNTHSTLKRDAAEGEMCVPLKAAEKDSGDVAACIAATPGESEGGGEVARFQPRDPPHKFKTASPPAGDVPTAFGPWRDAFEDWWCQMLGLVTLPANVDTTNDLTWLFDNGFTLDDIKAFYKWATTDPDEKKWRRGPVKIGTIVKGIADWRKQNREQAAAKPVVRQDFSWCLNGCDPKTGEIWLKGEGGAWVPTQCQHRRLEVMEDAA